LEKPQEFKRIENLYYIEESNTGSLAKPEFALGHLVFWIDHRQVGAGFLNILFFFLKKGSARAHVEGKDDLRVKVAPLLELAGNWRNFLSTELEIDVDSLRKHERSGRPL
jgi:hypothetical protein